MTKISYSTSKFWDKITSIPKKSHCAVIKKSLILYITLNTKNTPVWAKTAILSALIYFISPFGAYPDLSISIEKCPLSASNIARLK